MTIWRMRIKCCIPKATNKHPQSYTNIYVNTHLFLYVIQIYFLRGDMFRLIIQPSSGQVGLKMAV